MHFWVQLDKESFSLKAYFSDFGPIECIDFCITLFKHNMTKLTICSIKYIVTALHCQTYFLSKIDSLGWICKQVLYHLNNKAFKEPSNIFKGIFINPTRLCSSKGSKKQVLRILINPRF